MFVMTAAFISIMLLIVARHHVPTRRKIKEIWHGRVYWESNTTMLRSSSEKAATSGDVQRVSALLQGVSGTVQGVSGTVFSGDKIRKFNRKSLTNTVEELATIQFSTQYPCSKWAVVTTINAPTVSIHKVVDQSNFCVVIVADRKTPSKEYFELESERVYFLSVDKQEKMQDMAITQELPWNHFGRKNLGYLYAIQHGADVIFDFDDDNELISAIPSKISEPWLLADKTQVFNPYPMFVELEDVAWPRGFPLTQIQNISTWQVSTYTTINPNIGVIQSLANHDPDMDAIWRLTRKLPLNFDGGKRVVLPPGTYSSYNAQATIHYALWGTLLPVSVHGRVSDIWRSYIMQRLMHDVGQVVGFVSPFVKQVRNAHNYQGDYMSERPLYEKTEALIHVLSEWKGTSDMFEERFVELFIELYERNFIEIKDVHLAQKWIQTLQQMSYQFPTVVNGTNVRERNRGHKKEPAVDQAFTWPRETLLPSSKQLIWTELPVQTPSMTLTEILLHYKNKSDSSFVLNIGANDGCIPFGTHCDEANSVVELFQSDGLLLDISNMVALKNKFASYENVRLLSKAINPTNAVSILTQNKVPTQMSVLKIDIDSSDCDLLLEILHHDFSPDIIMQEYNPLFPPPVKYNFLYSPGLFRWGEKSRFPQQFYNGCSLQYLSDELQKMNYNLFQVTFWDAVFIKSTIRAKYFAEIPVSSEYNWWKNGWSELFASAPSSNPNVQLYLDAFNLTPEYSQDNEIDIHEWHNYVLKVIEKSHNAPQPYYLNVKTPSKRFVYLIQSSKPHQDSRLVPDVQRDVLYLCYKNACDTSGVPPNDVMIKGGTWTEGRNALLEMAVSRAEDMEQEGYLYYIFLDDDVSSMIQGKDAWILFEQWLNTKLPAVGYFTKSTSWQDSFNLGHPFNVDANANAFHRSTLGTLLPYDSSLDNQGIFFSQYIMNIATAAMFANNRLGFNMVDFNRKKNKHGSQTNYVRSTQWSVPKKYMSNVFVDGKLRGAVSLVNCHESETNKFCQYIPCGDRTLSGPASTTWISEHLNKDSSFTANLLSFVNHHSSFLDRFRREEFAPNSAETSCVVQSKPMRDQSILYLVQGPAKFAKKWKARITAMGKGTRVLYHSYDADCDDCIFDSTTNFASGRNLLLRNALNIQGIKFYVFVDYDITMECGVGNNDCWGSWNDFLLTTSDYLISPKTWHDPKESTDYKTCIDDAMVAIRQDKAHLMFPLPEKGIEKSWWHKTHATWSVFAKCIPNEHLSEENWRISNPKHAPYPSGISIPAIIQMLKDEYPTLDDWSNYNHLGHRCQVTTKKDKTCDAKLKKRYAEWIQKI